MEKGQTNNSNPSQYQSQAENGYEPEVFVSYAWGGESERIVDELEEAFKRRGIRLIRDKRDLKFRGSIEEFEKRIGRGQSIVLVISDKYLRSKHCMYELLQVSENKNLRERIFPIVLEDAQIYDSEDYLSYIEYWDEKIEGLNRSIKKRIRMMSKIKGITNDLEKYQIIRTGFDDLTDKLRDMNALTPDMHATDNYSTLISAVKEAMSHQEMISQPPRQSEPEIIVQPQKHADHESISPSQKQVVVKPGGLLGGDRRGCETTVKFVFVATGAVLVAGLLFTQLRPVISSLFSSPSPTPTLTATLTPSQEGTPTLELIPAAPIAAPPCTEKSTTRYGFDCGFQPWSIIEKKDNDSKAVTQATTTQVLNQYGNLTTVLVLTVDFTGGPDDRKTDSREKGEVEVNLSDLPPTGYEHTTVGDDLAGQTITAYVWASQGASGDPNHLNGFQLFIRDEKSISCYGNWTNIEPTNEEKWFRVVWKEPTMEEKLAETELAKQKNEKPRCFPEFNINKPMILGLKIAMGEESTKDYTTPLTIYLDDVDWLTPPP